MGGGWGNGARQNEKIMSLIKRVLCQETKKTIKMAPVLYPAKTNLDVCQDIIAINNFFHANMKDFQSTLKKKIFLITLVFNDMWERWVTIKGG